MKFLAECLQALLFGFGLLQATRHRQLKATQYRQLKALLAESSSLKSFRDLK